MLWSGRCRTAPHSQGKRKRQGKTAGPVYRYMIAADGRKVATNLYRYQQLLASRPSQSTD